MKKLLSIFVAAFLLVVAVVPFALSASAEESVFWISHFNDVTVEGSGVIITDESYNTNQAWRINIGFAPVEGEEGVYEITLIYDYLSSDASQITDTVPVPDGGFVYQLNYGNDYPTLGMVGPDYTSPSCSDMIAVAKTWSVGDRFTFTDLDLEGLTVSTSTPDVMWYEDAYVCTTTYSTVINSDLLPSESEEESEPASGESAPADDKSEPVADDSDASVPTSDNETNVPVTGIVIGIIAGVVAVVAVVVIIVVVAKKKK